MIIFNASRRFVLALILAVMLPLSGAQAEVLQMMADGRPFDLHQPAHAGSQALPLIIVLHGATGNGRSMARNLPLHRLMQTKSFRVAYLSSTKMAMPSGRQVSFWNDRPCCGKGIRPPADDVGYISAVVATMQKAGLVSTERVALVGHSNGAMMGYRMICERGDLFASYVALSGGQAIRNCQPLAHMKILHIHGAADRIVPQKGGAGMFNKRLIHPSLQQMQTAVGKTGARFQVVTLPRVGHPISAIDKGLEKRGAKGLLETITDFVFSP